jgi:hypothetical protein
LVHRPLDALWGETVQLLEEIQGPQELDEVRHRGRLPILYSLQGETRHPCLLGEAGLGEVAGEPEIAQATPELTEDRFVRF